MTVASRASVIIVNYNGAHLLPACLDGVARQQQDGIPFDTIVVDNASSDGSLELLALDYPWVKVIDNSANLGFAGGNNCALEMVRTPFAVLLNNDAVPGRHWLRNLLAVFSQPGNEDVGIVTGKILFAPRFVEVHLDTPGFQPSSSDSRELGVQIFGIRVDGVDVSAKVMWQQAAYGLEGHGAGAFRWSRPTGTILVPVPDGVAPSEGGADDPPSTRAMTISVDVVAQQVKPVLLTVGGSTHKIDAGLTRESIDFTVPAGLELVNVINNVGGEVFANGAGGDRGFQQIDRGQFEEPAEVFTACGNGMAMRTAIGHELGWFDDDFFMYYEDTDLSWRWRSAGWTIRYEPSAVLRHIHAASSKEWSPWWTFHVERNRLLMLTKNASRPLATAALRGFVRDTAATMAADAKRVILHRQRPDLDAIALRLRVVKSYSAKAPKALRLRRQLRRSARVPSAQLQRWLVTR